MPESRALRAPPLSTLIADRGEQVVTLAQLVTLLERVREEIIADAQEKSKRLHRQISDDFAAFTALSNRILASVCTSAIDTHSSRSRGSSSGRRSDQIPPEVENVDVLESPDLGASDYLQFLMLLTVMAFISNVPNASMWVSSSTRDRMERFMPILRQISGFSLVLFAVRSTDAKAARRRTAMGQARSLLLKWTFARKVALAREAIENARTAAGVPAPCPVWLQSFGNARATRRKISEIFDIIENADDTRGCDIHHSNGGPTATAPSVASEVPGLPGGLHDRRPNKRRRENGEANSDPVLSAQIFAVRTARKKLLRALSHGRSEVRKKLYTNLLFVLERIWSFENPTVARDNGYAVLFSPECEEDDVVPVVGPGMPENSPWSIPLALKRGQDTDENVRDINMQRFVALQRAFPGLAVKLKYKVSVRRSTSDESGGLSEFNDPNLALQASDDVSLHSVAASCLLGGSRASDFDEVLYASELSLRAIHVFALGLRGLLKKGLQYNGIGPLLSDIEKYALGEVSARLVQKGDQQVTAMFGAATKGTGEGTESPTELEKLRRAKLEMSWMDYRKRRASETAIAERIAFSEAYQSDSENSAEGNDWVDYAGI